MQREVAKPQDVRSFALSIARQDLAAYAIAQFPAFELARHHAETINRLEAVERGEITRLMIFEPPRHGKTLLTTQLFPAWYLGRHPERYVITAAYGQDLADDYGRRVRNFVTDERHQAIFPECQLASDSSSVQRFNTTAGGAYFTVGRGAAITGRGAHLLVIDDPLKDREEANSETIRRSLHDWYRSVAYTRLQPGGAVVIVQTRWHVDDLAGRLLREALPGQWQVLSLPAISEDGDSFRRAGEALWPEKFPLQVLEEIRTTIGSAAFVSLYQQQPVATEGQIFKREWWKYYRDAPAFQRIVQSWDTAFQAKKESDYSVGTTWGVTATGYYLLNVWRARVEFPELKRQVIAQAAQFKPAAVIIEDKASGQSLIQELKRETALPILAIKVDSDKIARAQAATPVIEAGKVFLPESAPWLADYLDELSSFAAGAHDDAVDSTTQALNHLRGSLPPILQAFQQLVNEPPEERLKWRLEYQRKQEEQLQAKFGRPKPPAEPTEEPDPATADPNRPTCGAKKGPYICTVRPHGPHAAHRCFENGRMVACWPVEAPKTGATLTTHGGFR